MTSGFNFHLSCTPKWSKVFKTNTSGQQIFSERPFLGEIFTSGTNALAGKGLKEGFYYSVLFKQHPDSFLVKELSLLVAGFSASCPLVLWVHLEMRYWNCIIHCHHYHRVVQTLSHRLLTSLCSSCVQWCKLHQLHADYCLGGLILPIFTKRYVHSILLARHP